MNTTYSLRTFRVEILLLDHEAGRALLLPILARSIDRWLTKWLIKKVSRPESGIPEPRQVLDSPDDIPAQQLIQPQMEPLKPQLWKYEAASRFRTLGEDQGTLRGQLMGPPDARAAVVVMHGAYAEYIHCQMVARSFVKRGYRVLIPAAPFHLDRALPDSFNGAPMFWTSQLFVASMAQWLAEVNSLIQWLRSEGAQVVGTCGHSVGSLASGLAATLWPDLDFAILMSPVGHHLEAIHRSELAAAIWPWMQQIPAEDVELLDRWAPCRRHPTIEQLLFMMTQFDDLQPTELQRKWWQDWNRPACHEYRHGHISVVYGKQMYRDLEQFAADRL